MQSKRPSNLKFGAYRFMYSEPFHFPIVRDLGRYLQENIPTLRLARFHVSKHESKYLDDLLHQEVNPEIYLFDDTTGEIVHGSGQYNLELVDCKKKLDGVQRKFRKHDGRIFICSNYQERNKYDNSIYLEGQNPSNIILEATQFITDELKRRSIVPRKLS